MIIAIDAGHSLINTKRNILIASEKDYIKEWILNDKICKTIEKRMYNLYFCNEPIYIIRTDRASTERSVDERVKYAEKNNANILLSIHCSDNSENNDISIYISKESYPSINNITNEVIYRSGLVSINTVLKTSKNRILSSRQIPSMMINFNIRNFEKINEFADLIADCIIHTFDLRPVKNDEFKYSVKKNNDNKIYLQTSSLKKAIKYCNESTGLKVYDQTGKIVYSSTYSKVNTIKQNNTIIIGYTKSINGTPLFEDCDLNSYIKTTIPYGTKVILLKRMNKFWNVIYNISETRKIIGYILEKSINIL